MIKDNTPVLIGVGQAAEAPDRRGYRALSSVDLAAEAGRAAVADCEGSAAVVEAIDAVAAIRQFEISTPVAVAPFGRSNNLPRSIAARVGARPRRAILEISGGQGPQRILGELAQAIAEGRSDCALIAGSEAMSTALYLKARGESPDWSEEIDGDIEDRGFGIEGMSEPALRQHGLVGAISTYALFENARRGRLGLSLDEYRRDIAALFAPFTVVAAANPYAAAPVVRTVSELATVSERNRIVAEPYTRMTVARDQVNQAAALIVCSAKKARALDVPETRWVHIHAIADADELSVLKRPDLSKGPASVAAARAALELSGKTAADIDWFDLYSCFAIPVFNFTDALGISPVDPRGLTLTGGLPFFGGAGNNYSMHAIAEAVARARGRRGRYAFIGANGGLMSKYSAGVYSTDPADWSDPVVRRVALPKARDAVAVGSGGGRGRLETFTVVPGKQDSTVAIIARLEHTDERVVASPEMNDVATLGALVDAQPFGRAVDVVAGDTRNTFTFAE